MSEVFGQLCPYYIAIGMTADQYWNGDNWLPYYYAEAHRLRTEMKNQELWLQGLYIYDAFGVVLANAFAKKGSKSDRYMKEPIDLFPERTAERKRQEAQDKVVAMLNQFKRNWDSKHKGDEHGRGNQD